MPRIRVHAGEVLSEDSEPTFSLAALARSWAEITGEAWESVLYRLGDWAITDAFPDDAFLAAGAGETTFHKKVIFDRARWHRDLVDKLRGAGDPNEKARLQKFADLHMQAVETAVLRRDVVVEACRAMHVAPPPILGLVASVSAKHRVPPECPPDSLVGVFAREAEQDQTWRHRGEVMAPDEADKYTLLWDAAAEMSRTNGRSLEWNWLRLMDAFWRGDLARAGLAYFYRGAKPGREFVIHDREVLASLLLGWRPLEDGTREPTQPIDILRHWTVPDYLGQPAPFGDYFRADPEGRFGLAILSHELNHGDRGEGSTGAPDSVVPEQNDDSANRSISHLNAQGPKGLSPHSTPALKGARKRGAKRTVRDRVIAEMRSDIREEHITREVLHTMREKELEDKYGCSRDTARKARNEVLADVDLSRIPAANSRQIATNDK